MDPGDFDGTLVLEALAAIDQLDRYADAVDADDFEEASRLLRLAGFDSATIALVLEQMSNA